MSMCRFSISCLFYCKHTHTHTVAVLNQIIYIFIHNIYVYNGVYNKKNI